MKPGQKDRRLITKLSNYALWIIILPSFIAVILVSLLKFDRIRTTLAKEDSEQLAKAIEQKLDFIGAGHEKSKDPRVVSSDMSTKYEQAIREWLNDKDFIHEAGLKCISVNLKKEAFDTYLGQATFNKGEQVNVEVGRDEDSGELYFKANPPAIVRVYSSILPGYEYTTIGKAFNTFFADPNWTTWTVENGGRFVDFTGRLKNDLLLIDLSDDPFISMEDTLRLAYVVSPSWVWKQADQACIRFAFSHDGENFELWSIQRGEDNPMRANDWEKQAMINKLFEAVYELK